MQVPKNYSGTEYFCRYSHNSKKSSTFATTRSASVPFAKSAENESDPQKVQQQVDAAEPQIDEVIAMIRQHAQGNKSHDSMPYFFRPFTDRLLTYERQTKFFGMDKSKCIGCGLCAKKCPVQAIEMQETAKTETNKTGKNPVWTAERCALCLGCLHRCPKFAINYNNKTQAHGQYQHSKYYQKQ